MAIPLRVLVVDDSEDDTTLLIHKLRRSNYDPTFRRVDTPKTMRDALMKDSWDIVIADYTMPNFSGTHALNVLQKTALEIPFIIVSGTISEEIAVTVMKAGAHDYIRKDNLARLIPAIERELRDAEVRREHKHAEERIRHMAYYDLLTDLPNRSLLFDRLEQAIHRAKRDKNSAALILMDLDRFKEINDTLGHSQGDYLLKQVGKRLGGVLRESDTVARLGGDEFAILLPKTDKEGAKLVMDKILTSLEPAFVIESLPILVEISAGITVYPRHGEDADSIIQRADVAMYVAKQRGNSFAFYSPDQDAHSTRRLALMGELRHALEENQLSLHYQPLIDLKKNDVVGVEALARWQHPKHGYIPPVEFIPLAERSGLIRPFTQSVLCAAIYRCRIWQQEGINLSVSVNLSVKNIQDPELTYQIKDLLEVTGVPATQLELEITESAIMSDPLTAKQVLEQLADMHIRFSIDDFGTGYSSLAYLKKLPVSTIKIDRSFVMNMMTNKDDMVIVQSIIDLAHNLGLRVIAEGVETREILDHLAELGCDEAQGYYISRPVPASDLTKWLSTSPWGFGKNQERNMEGS